MALRTREPGARSARAARLESEVGEGDGRARGVGRERILPFDAFEKVFGVLGAGGSRPLECRGGAGIETRAPERLCVWAAPPETVEDGLRNTVATTGPSTLRQGRARAVSGLCNREGILPGVEGPPLQRCRRWVAGLGLDPGVVAAEEGFLRDAGRGERGGVSEGEVVLRRGQGRGRRQRDEESEWGEQHGAERTRGPSAALPVAALPARSLNAQSPLESLRRALRTRSR